MDPHPKKHKNPRRLPLLTPPIQQKNNNKTTRLRLRLTLRKRLNKDPPNLTKQTHKNQHPRYVTIIKINPLKILRYYNYFLINHKTYG